MTYTFYSKQDKKINTIRKKIITIRNSKSFKEFVQALTNIN